MRLQILVWRLQLLISAQKHQCNTSWQSCGSFWSDCRRASSEYLTDMTFLYPDNLRQWIDFIQMSWCQSSFLSTVIGIMTDLQHRLFFVWLAAFSRKKLFFTKIHSTEKFSLFCIFVFLSVQWFLMLNVFITSVHYNGLLILRPGGGGWIIQSWVTRANWHHSWLKLRFTPLVMPIGTRDPGLNDPPSLRDGGFA